MKAVIMAGGEGTRLRPLTSNAPKPMLPLVNRPMMEHIVDLLKRHGIDEIVVTVAFMANTIRDYFGDGSEFGVTHDLRHRGDARSARPARSATPWSTSTSASSSSPVTCSPTSISARSSPPTTTKDAMATIGLAHVDNPLEFGIVITREDGSIERFLEKPTWGQVFSDTINTGIFVLEPEIFDYIEDGRPVDFSGEVFPGLLARRQAPLRRRRGGLLGGRRHARVLRAGPQGHPRRPGARRHPGLRDPSRASGWARTPTSTPTPPSSGPPSSATTAGSRPMRRSGEYTVLGANVRMRQDASLERTVVHDNAYLGEGVRLRGTVVGRSCDLRKGVRAEEGVVLGDECFVGDDASIGAEVKIYPFKTVEAGAVVNDLHRLGVRGARSLFGGDGVGGLANVDVTPEFATRVAMAFGDHAQARTPRSSPPGTPVRSARMLKRAMMAGLNAGGVNVEDLEVASVPVTRFIIRRPTARGWPHGPARRRRPPVGRRSASSTATASTSPRTPSARSSGSSPARTSGGCSPARSATSASPRGRSSTTPRRSRRRSTSTRSRGVGSRS